MDCFHNKIVLTVLVTLSTRGRVSTNVVGDGIDYIFLTLASLENNDTVADLYLLLSLSHWLGNAFLWPFSLPIHWRSHLKKQYHDPDVGVSSK